MMTILRPPVIYAFQILDDVALSQEKRSAPREPCVQIISGSSPKPNSVQPRSSVSNNVPRNACPFTISTSWFSSSSSGKTSVSTISLPVSTSTGTLRCTRTLLPLCFSPVSSPVVSNISSSTTFSSITTMCNGAGCLLANFHPRDCSPSCTTP